MSLSLEGIKGLMRCCEGLPNNMSETEIRHYAAQVLKRLKGGDSIEALEIYLRRIDTSSSRKSRVSAGTYELAERAFVLFKGQ